jgi:hypothetical protein
MLCLSIHGVLCSNPELESRWLFSIMFVPHS